MACIILEDHQDTFVASQLFASALLSFFNQQVSSVLLLLDFEFLLFVHRLYLLRRVHHHDFPLSCLYEDD
jgi:hypothetical protein